MGFFFLLLVFTQSFARPDLPPQPEKLLEAAKKGQSELLLALSEVERFVPTFGTKEQIYPYIQILSELNRISARYPFETFGSNPVREFGLLLTQNALKWIGMESDPWEVVENFLTWTDTNSRSVVANKGAKEVVLVEDKVKLLNWNERVLRAMKLVTELKSPVFVLESFYELQAVVIGKLLFISQKLTEEETAIIIRSARSVPAIQAVSAFLRERILITQDPNYLRTMLDWVTVLGGTTSELKAILPYFVMELPGSLVNHILVRTFKKGWSVSTNAVSAALLILSPGQCIELAESFLQSFRERAISEIQVPFLSALSKRLKMRFDELGIEYNSEDLLQFFRRLVSLEQALLHEVEGSYSVSWGKARGLLTIAHIGSGVFFASVNREIWGDRNSNINLPFYRMSYSDTSDTWEGTKYAVGDPQFSVLVNEVYFLKAKFKKQGQDTFVEGDLITVQGQFHISGKKKESYFSPSPLSDPLFNKPQGLFRGPINGGVLELTVYSFSPKPMGILNLKYFDTLGFQSLPLGVYDSLRGVISLSQNNDEASGWTLVRGQFSDNGNKLTGQMISSERGIVHRFVLDRVNELVVDP